MILDLDQIFHRDHQLTRGLYCKMAVTTGVMIAVIFLWHGYENQALWASFAAYMIWIWEGA